MKKFLITVLPILVILFCCMWVIFDLKHAIACLIAIPFGIIVIAAVFKWVEFVDKHIKD